MANDAKKFYDIRLLPAQLHDRGLIQLKLQRKIGKKIDLNQYQLIRRSIDARKKPIVYQLRFQKVVSQNPLPSYNHVKATDHAVVIVGSGPAGLFTALGLLAQGIKPIILERGKDVRTRRRDLKAIQQKGVVNPDSNYCYGEGGAGTYSDGKLYTRSKKRGSVRQILQILVLHGAHPDILIDAHPHIGSNKLPKVIANMRKTILDHGGEIHFNKRVIGLGVDKAKISSVTTLDGHLFEASNVVIATGHSARDIYKILKDIGISMVGKSFAMGIRVEHPQVLIDEIQYNQNPRHTNLPAASYQLTCQVSGQGVFSFCMCPGGLVVPSATSPGEIVVNGMSLSRRDSAFANSGIVTEIPTAMFEDSVFGGIEFQKKIEQRCYQLGDGTQRAPAQRLTDFIQGHLSTNLPKSSYIPGLYSARLDKLYPQAIYNRLSTGLIMFGAQLPGYVTSEAVIIAPESRTSSPVRILRNAKTLMSDQVEGLYPCGEGAGYAGGIISAAIDGWNVAQAIAQTVVH